MESVAEKADAWLRARRGKSLVYLFVLALGIPFLCLTQYAASPFFWVPRMDALYHSLQAHALAHRQAPAEPYFRAPLYLWLLSGVYATLGEGPWAPRLVQLVVGSGSVLLLYLLGERLFRPCVAFLAAVSMALYGPLVYNNLELHTPVVEVFFTLAALTALVRSGVGLKGVALAGGLAGLAALARPNALVLLPLGLWYLWQTRRPWRALVLFVVLALLPPLAVTLRNARVSGDPVFIASQGGINLYLGNRAHADGFTPSTPQRYRFDSAYEDSVALYGQRAAEEALGKRLRPSEVSRYWVGQTLRWWQAHPREALALTLKKAILTLSSVEIRNNTGYHYIREAWVPLLWLAPFGFAWAGPLGGVGLFLALRRHPQRAAIQLLVGFLGLYFLSIVVFFAADRFRLPLVPLLLLFAVEGGWQLLHCYHERLGKQALVLLAGLLLLVGGDWFRLPRAHWDSQDCWSAGNRLLALKRPDDAELYLRRALQQEPANAEYWTSLGEAAYLKGELSPAQEAFARALQLSPESPQSYYNLAVCLQEQGKSDEARGYLLQALARDPGYTRARTALAAISSAGR
ncbi:tetratricopeptide repeat protein [Armatimonas rosea]|uniref:4-amino-4-deoxy-L-arabinose transferase-like glycosyltransferase n=1 Tax=Armatimonas rosea TaxID=685828 RepID=A0A7W9SNX5_ARMRO|nr:4-amino-4-deoxy-L-arabinose transferase-like glycosyltransferase [Armatimonas rosea]